MSAVLSPAAPKPAHVPDSAVYDFDYIRDPAMSVDPHERLLDLHRRAPEVFWTPRNGGHWVLLTHEAATTAERNPDIFSSALLRQQVTELPPDVPRLPQPTPILMDPPTHTKYRLPLQAVFAPKIVAKLKDDIRALSDELIDKLLAAGPRCEFVGAFAEIMPVTVFLRLMGLPQERLAEFRQIIHAYFSPDVPRDPISNARRQYMVIDAIKDIMIARRDNPQDDLISRLWATEVDGAPMTMDVMEDFSVLLFVAGLDTVVNGIAYVMRRIASDSELQARLRADPELISETIEETLRRHGFVSVHRSVTQDVELCGRSLKAGDRLLVHLPAANLDAKRFEDPAKFDIARKDKAHITFGAGPHRCVGSHLARIELQITFEQILKRLPPFRLDPDKPVQFRIGDILAVESVPIVWDA